MTGVDCHLPDESSATLAISLSPQNGSVMVVKVKGKRLTTFIKAFRPACTKAGCPGHIPHDLRRTAVRNLVRAGIPERVAMQMTGHKTRSVFEPYNTVSECDLVEAAKKLNVMQPVAASDRDGHNSGTVSPERGSRLRMSL